MYNQPDRQIPVLGNGNQNPDEFYEIIPIRALERIFNKYSESFKSLPKEQLGNLDHIVKVIIKTNTVINLSENIELKNKYENLKKSIQEENDAKKSS